MNRVSLHQQNLAFRGTTGISQNNAETGFKPAFLDKRTGRIELGRFRNGLAAPMHLISWLPPEWGISWDHQGAITELQPSIIAGFVKEGVFYTREQAAEL